MAPKHSRTPSPSHSLNSHLHSDSLHSIRTGDVRVVEPGPSEPDDEQKMMAVIVRVRSEKCYQQNIGDRDPETLVGGDRATFIFMLQIILHHRTNYTEETKARLWDMLQDKCNVDQD